MIVFTISMIKFVPILDSLNSEPFSIYLFAKFVVSDSTVKAIVNVIRSDKSNFIVRNQL